MLKNTLQKNLALGLTGDKEMVVGILGRGIDELLMGEESGSESEREREREGEKIILIDGQSFFPFYTLSLIILHLGEMGALIAESCFHRSRSKLEMAPESDLSGGNRNNKPTLTDSLPCRIPSLTRPSSSLRTTDRGTNLLRQIHLSRTITPQTPLSTSRQKR